MFAYLQVCFGVLALRGLRCCDLCCFSVCGWLIGLNAIGLGILACCYGGWVWLCWLVWVVIYALNTFAVCVFGLVCVCG